MNKFQPGDKVRRVKGEHWGHAVGDTGTVASCDGDALKLVSRPGTHQTRNFELISATGGEKDPNGKDAHSPGAKLDAGKVRPALVLGGFARALLRVSEVGTKGAAKYTDNGWMEVPNGEARYNDAMLRHWLKEQAGEEADDDSELEHAAHAAWNALARLDLLLRRKEKAGANAA